MTGWHVRAPWLWIVALVGALMLFEFVRPSPTRPVDARAAGHLTFTLGHTCPAGLPLPMWVRAVSPASRVKMSGPGLMGYLGDGRQAVVWTTTAWRYQAFGPVSANLVYAPPFTRIEGVKLPGHGVFQLSPRGSAWEADAAWSVDGQCRSVAGATNLSLLSTITALIQSSARFASVTRFVETCATPGGKLVCHARPVE